MGGNYIEAFGMPISNSPNLGLLEGKKNLYLINLW